jgi:ABC-type Fe3+-hydroxamate transport system substrate-binding protein
MVAGADNYIHSILGQLGFENCAEKLSGRYPEIDTQDLKNLSPDVIFLSSEPYLFNQDHAKEIAQLFPEAKLFLVDGEMFSWYGSRMLKAADYFLQHIELWKS